jgi:hypothetical protein
MTMQLKANEMVLKACETQQIAGNSEVRGKLILTNQRVYFKSKTAGKAMYDLELLFNQIKEVLFFRNRLLFPNGLKVVTRDGRELCFAIASRNSWCQAIARMC